MLHDSAVRCARCAAAAQLQTALQAVLSARPCWAWVAWSQRCMLPLCCACCGPSGT